MTSKGRSRNTKTTHNNYPTTPGAYHTSISHLINGQAIVTKLSMLPAGVERFGHATKGSKGMPTIGTISYPKVGVDGFAVYGSQLTPNGNGWLALSTAKLTSPIQLSGVDFYLAPANLLLVPVTAGPFGYCEVHARLPVSLPVGTTWYTQFVFKDPAATFGMSASNALEITVQG